MEYTTQVHAYTLKIPARYGSSYNELSVLSVEPVDTEKFLKTRDSGCILEYHGLVEAKETHTTCSPWDGYLYGYKKIHTSRDSRGCFSSDIHVPCNWDENHPIVKKIKGKAKQEQEAENNYYSRVWV